MDSGALRKRAAWLHAVATRLPSHDVSVMLDGYADELKREAERADGHRFHAGLGRLAR